MAYFAALKRIMNGGGMDLDIIVNPKMSENGQAVLQVCHPLRTRDTFSDC
jgi:hypothetical protein